MTHSTVLEKSFNALFFDLCSDGHHPAYIKHLVKYWCQSDHKGTVSFVVHPDFIKAHSDIVQLASSTESRQVRFISIQPEEALALPPMTPRLSRAARYFKEWTLFCKYAESLNASHGFLLYLDTYKLPMLLGRKPQCPVSGIYFRPKFHYPALQGSDVSHLSWREQLQVWSEKQILYRCLNLPYFSTALCLDPFAANHIDSSKISGRLMHLPDPVDLGEVNFLTDKGEDRLPGGGRRLVFLFFGRIDQRKGVFQALSAIEDLPPEACQKFKLLIVGQASQADISAVESKVSQIMKKLPVDIFYRLEFVSDREMADYFSMADVVLAPYQEHVGMSGILLQAAAAQKPVLSSNYGLMGELVKRYRLGITVDSTSPLSIAKGFLRFLQEDISKTYDIEGMLEILKENSADKFSKRIFKVLKESNL
jgi:glycosyltransferase involved in cell wall biosynthesis